MSLKRGSAVKQKFLVDVVWKLLVIPEYGTTKSANDAGISRKSIELAVVDLDDDGNSDALVLLGKDYCGSDGCTLTVVKTTKQDERVIDLCRSVHLSTPIFLLNSKHNGLHDLLVNQSEALVFNGKTYCHE